MRGVVLYGPPASGKDTITTALHQLDTRYVLFPRLKVGPGRTAGYRMTTMDTVDELRATGDVIWENRRYRALYVVDRPAIRDRLHQHVPVVHLGQAEAVTAVTQAIPDARWLVVSLWCPREVAERRIIARGTSDTEARLQAFDATTSLPNNDLTINTADITPEDAAQRIHNRLNQM